MSNTGPATPDLGFKRTRSWAENIISQQTKVWRVVGPNGLTTLRSLKDSTPGSTCLRVCQSPSYRGGGLPTR